MITLPLAQRTPASGARALEIMLRSREGAQSTKFGRAPAIAFSYNCGTHIDEPGDVVFRHACKLGFESEGKPVPTLRMCFLVIGVPIFILPCAS